LRFYPGSGPASAFPLARFLPPLPAGMAAAWLADNIPTGSWVLDPLGASPALLLEMAQAGYRVLSASNNPILSFMLETLASAPQTADFQSVLAELAMTRRGDQRLEQMLRELYLTICESCGEQVEAQAFLWRKGETQPYARLYRCPKCGDSTPRERPITPADLDRLNAMGGDRMQRARAIQRVILNDNEPRADVEAALDNYLPRSLYVLFTMLNKIEGLGLPPQRLRLLQAMLLSVFDAGSTLWPWPGGRSRPRQLNVPPQFRENNLWQALEESPAQWTSWGQKTVTHRRVHVTRWPELPPVIEKGQPGAICLFRGRVKTLAPLLAEINPQAVVTVFPRPSQAFWTLSVLWAGWLWGAEAALPLRNVLDRRRYDWNWHTSAVHSALAAISGSLPPETPFFGLLPELAPGFLSAVLVAGQAAGFNLEGLALRGEQDFAQALWKPAVGAGLKQKEQPRSAPQPDLPSPILLEQAARSAIQADLLERGEPAPYILEYAAGLQALAQVGGIPHSPNSIPGELLTRVQAVLARTFADRSFLRLYGTRQESGSAEEERGWWWLSASPVQSAHVVDVDNFTNLPLADQIEIEVVRFMQKQVTFTLEAVDDSLCAHFKGLLTPSSELIRSVVESYGETVHGKAGVWRMRSSETAAARRADLQDIRAALILAGEKMGYRTSGRGSLLSWINEEGGEVWRFYLLASSLISRYILENHHRSPECSLLVLPGSRARLLSLKLRRDPRLAEAARSWRLLKFRHLREITARPDLTTDLWTALLDEDPLTDEASQMRLFK
jgi:hypothetical protein